MNMNAIPRGIKSILEANRKYIVPRFQREYSWEENELLTLWEDIFKNISICKESGILEVSNYFIGSLVLIGNDTNGEEFEIVDGQQRLTTISILLAAIGDFFYKEKEEKKGDAIFRYIEGTDKEGELFFKLVNENTGNFLPCRILAKKKDYELQPRGKEEVRLLNAYNYFFDKLNDDELIKDFKKYIDMEEMSSIGIDTMSSIDIAKLIRDQILEFTIVFITVDNLSDAYKIFETLNAKGKNLEAIDLIKNSIFSVLTEKHPSDKAKDIWKKIQENLNGENRDLFYRQFWISKYSFSTKRDLYKSFNKTIHNDKDRYLKFLEELDRESIWYESIINPIYENFPQQDDRFEYDALKAFKIFNVSQVRVILLSLKRAKEEKRIKFNDYKRAIEALERFHFMYIAICSGSGSGIERILSKNSLNITNTKEKAKMKTVIDKLISDLRNKKPEYEIFESNFEEVVFTNTKTKQKKLIQYIFKTIENKSRSTRELIINDVTIEHIMSQSNKNQCVGKIGNLIPLDANINSKMGNIDFDKKIECLKSSELNTVKAFIKNYGNSTKWDEKYINERTKKIAKEAYDTIWNF